MSVYTTRETERPRAASASTSCPKEPGSVLRTYPASMPSEKGRNSRRPSSSSESLLAPPSAAAGLALEREGEHEEVAPRRRHLRLSLAIASAPASGGLCGSTLPPQQGRRGRRRRSRSWRTRTKASQGRA
ncbi:hypothetical protein BDA96_04G095200 [Sorghum bicolor]|uniref:Uncharacterized protein n=1 Tax=Sorghum bicolor TaxID=4558 RepID=A0A921UHJ1_SORBI|nr:hypothetical protein BDA96_04G095200 [Sorghum bicolor]